MSETEKPAEDRAKEEAKLPLGKNANASKLIDAAILIFIVSGFSIVTSASSCLRIVVTLRLRAEGTPLVKGPERQTQWTARPIWCQ